MTLASPRVVGVEGPQRVEVDALPHLGGEGVLVLMQVGLQLGPVGRAYLGRAERGDPQAHVACADRVEQLGQQEDRLGVDRRVVGADRLDPDLPELSEAAGLRRLVAVEARQVPEAHGLGQLVHAVLDVGAADRRGALGS